MVAGDRRLRTFTGPTACAKAPTSLAKLVRPVPRDATFAQELWADRYWLCRAVAWPVNATLDSVMFANMAWWWCSGGGGVVAAVVEEEVEWWRQWYGGNDEVEVGGIKVRVS